MTSSLVGEYAGQTGGRSTGTNRQSCRSCGAIDHDAMVGYLRRRFPHATASAVSGASGVPAGTVENWLSGKSSIGGGAFARLAFWLGPDFLAAAWVAAPDWLSRAKRDAERLRLDREIAILLERLRAVEADGDAP